MSKRPRTMADIARDLKANALLFPATMSSDAAYARVSDRRLDLLDEYNKRAILKGAPLYHELPTTKGD